MPITVIGADKVAQEFANLSNGVSNAQSKFINTIATETISLLKQNTPIDTGELSRSWYELGRTTTTTTIGVLADQRDKLRYVIFGTRHIAPNDFVSPVLDVIWDNIESVMLTYMKASHPYLSNISTGTGRGIKTPSNIVGLTKSKFMKRRGRGRSTIRRISTGRKTLNARIGRHRKV